MSKLHRAALSSLLLCVLLVFALVARAQGSGAQPGAVPGQIVLRAPKGTAEAQVQAMAEAAGCRIVQEIPYSPGYYVLETKSTSGAASSKPTRASAVTPEVAAAVARLKANAGVLAEPNYLVYKSQTAPAPAPVPTSVTPNDPLYDLQSWHLNMINMPRAWALQRGTRPVVVAVLDTGIDVGHPDLVDNTDPRGRNFSTADPADIDDPDGHGTHVSGTIAATTNNALGVASVAGWDRNGVDVRILPVRVLGPGGSGSVAGIVAGISYAVTQNVDVINMSLGSGPGFIITAYDQPIQEALAAGVVVVAAAGNDLSSQPVSPADNPGVIKVSAVDATRKLAYYSNFSGNVAITAPGGYGPALPPRPANEHVVSTYRRGAVLTPDTGYPGPSGDGYQGISGTSMAAPHVAGAAALLKAAGIMDPAQIRFLLQSTAQPLPDDVPNFNGGNKYGAGLLDVGAALAQAILPNIDLLTPQDQTVTLIRTISISVLVRNPGEMEDDDLLVITIQPITGGTSTPITLTKTAAEIPDDATSVTVTFPAQTLSEGRYRVEATLQADVPDSDSAFVTIQSRSQPVGRSMFAVPFVVQDLFGGREVSLFGTGSSFTLQRWDPQVSAYASWSSAGVPQDRRASFNPTIVGETSITFDSTNPNVSVEPVGLGYWLDLDSDAPLNISGTEVRNPVGIRLVAEKVGANGALINPGGWNMIGAPFTFPVDWNAVSVRQGQTVYTLQQAVDQGIMKGVLVGYAGGGYVFSFAPTGSLQPFNGYWVRALQDCELIVPPLPGSGRAAASSQLPGGSAGWRARLIATVAGDRDSQNYFGQLTGAETGEDKFDVAKPPSGAGHAYVRFLGDPKQKDGGASRAGAFAFDMRPAGAAKEEWVVAVTSDRENADVTLSWEGLSGVPRRSRLTLTDSVSGQKVSLRSRSSYTYRSGEAGETRRFTLTVDPQASSGPLAIANVRTASSRAVSGLAVRFTLNQEAEVSGRVLSMGGKTIARLGGGGRSASTTETVLRWDGTGEQGAAVPSGPYVVEITARGTDGQVARVKRPIMLLR